MVNSPLIRPYFLGGWHWGGTLDPHDIYNSLLVYYDPQTTGSYNRLSLPQNNQGVVFICSTVMPFFVKVHENPEVIHFSAKNKDTLPKTTIFPKNGGFQ